MAMAFQKMLKQFSLTEKIHVVNADNASAIDKQTNLLSWTTRSNKTTMSSVSTTGCNSVRRPSLCHSTQPSIRTQDDEMPEEGNEDDIWHSEDEDNGIDELNELSESEQAGYWRVLL